VPVKEPAPSAPTIESVAAPEASAGVLEIEVSLPETNADGTALARAELVRLRLHHSTSPGVDESDPYVDFPPSETLLWAPNDTVAHYVRVRVQDSHGLWSELSNEASGQANAATVAQEDSGLWAHRLGVESIFTNDSPDPGYVSWSNVVLYWKDNKYEIEDGSTNKKYIWWDYSTSTTTFQTSDTRPELDLEDVIIGYNDNGTWRLMCYQPTVMADYVRAGVLQSSNWGATTGSQFNLDDGTFKLGGSDSPKLSWDGSTLSIEGNVTITGGSGVANLSDAGALATLDVVGTAQIDDLAVTTAKIADAAITTAKIDDLAVTEAKIADAAITNAKIADAAITNAKIADATITDAKIASLSADKITTGTLDASQVNVINLNANNITAGTLTGRTVQTAAYGLRASMVTSGTYAHSFMVTKDSYVLALLKGTTAGDSELSLHQSGDGRIVMKGLSDGGKITLYGTGALLEFANEGGRIKNAILDSKIKSGNFELIWPSTNTTPTSYTSLNTGTGCRALVFLKLYNGTGATQVYYMRAGDETDMLGTNTDATHGLVPIWLESGKMAYTFMLTDASGNIDFMADSARTGLSIWRLAYIKLYPQD